MVNLFNGVTGSKVSLGAGNIDRQYQMYPLQNPFLPDIRMHLGGSGGGGGGGPGGAGAPGYYYPAGVLPNQAYDPKFGAAGGIEHGGFGNEHRGHEYGVGGSAGGGNGGGGSIVDPNIGYGHHPPPSYHSESPSGHSTKSKGSSTAMTALTLLAFLFFLNILQNCLKEHMDTMNPTVMVMTAGVRSEPINERVDTELSSKQQQSDQHHHSSEFNDNERFYRVDETNEQHTDNSRRLLANVTQPMSVLERRNGKLFV